MKLSYRAIERGQSEPDNQDQIMWIKHPELEGQKDSDQISYKKLPYTSEIIKAKLTNRHLNNILAGSLKSKKLID